MTTQTDQVQATPEQTPAEEAPSKPDAFMDYAAADKAENSQASAPETKDQLIESLNERDSAQEGDQANKTENKEDKTASDWLLDEDVPGTGAKPASFNDKKYKTVEDQLKAQSELAARFGDLEGAPEKYDLEFNKDSYVEVDPEAPVMKEFFKAAKQMNLSQTGFEKLVDIFGRAVEDLMPPTLDDIKEELGDKAQDLLARNANWLKSRLSPGAQQAVSNSLDTPLLMAIDELRRFSPEQGMMPNVAGANAAKTPSKADLEAYMRDNPEAFWDRGPGRQKIMGMAEQIATSAGLSTNQ